MQTIFTNKQMC